MTNDNEDYKALRQINEACEKEYKRLVKCYNNIINENKIMRKSLKTIKNMASAELLNSIATKRIRDLCDAAAPLSNL